ncbi:MAG: hypothetical protein F6K11_13225 [Leptolyngbya sp. SIO3F4]|nr:hypothetical protein [Leptolyngbya sp. SIO3F4]
MDTTEVKDGVAAFYASSSAVWRSWLETNHASAVSVWLILYKKDSGTPSLTYREAVEEALCFGWIDSKPNKRDAVSYYQFFARRNAKSNWSRLNKTIVERLLTEGRMAPAGLEMIRVAKETGTWTALDDVENLVVPDDLQHALDKYPKAFAYWEAFPRSVKRGILEWILNAKRPATRQKRIEETARMAAENKRANQFRA